MVQGMLNSYLSKKGKNVRPEMVSIFGDLLGIPEAEIEVLGRVAEMIHTASLIHDDVIDRAEKRRGQVAMNMLMSNCHAVLSGDYLMAQAIHELTLSNNIHNLQLLSQALQDMIEGEFIQDSFKSGAYPTLNDLINIAEKKTGALMSWSCAAAAVYSEQDQAIISNCQEFGKKLGVAFQMIDDNLDFSHSTGKPFAGDLKEGLINFTVLEMLNIYPELYYPVGQLRGKVCDEYPWSDNELNTAISLVRSKANEVMDEAISLLNEIINNLEVKPERRAVQNIYDLIEKMRSRSL